MNNNWYDTQNWYAPLNPDQQDEFGVSEKKASAETKAKSGRSGKKRGKTKKKGLTPARIAGLILLLLLVIAGTSIAFRQMGSGSDAVLFDDGGEIPDDPESFFKQYYEAVEGGSMEVNVPAMEGIYKLMSEALFVSALRISVLKYFVSPAEIDIVPLDAEVA